ncbi:MAG: hypothetical protein JWM80_163 [Cyanobacteria bacterium RYN_339]|nr:hypothetical protein [Cyanobacteria bacterium RYN_339]
MSLIFEQRHVLVLPDGTEQELEWPPHVRTGDLIASDVVGISPEPDGKYIVTRMEEIMADELPHIMMYYLERF